MKRDEKIKELLIANAIHLIAEGGFEKATTKALTYHGVPFTDFKMNEVYIYRLFGSKEKLYEAAFLQLAGELFYTIRKEMKAIGGFEQDTKERFYELFRETWRFILGNEEKCRCYIRYYYSIYFKGSARETHEKYFKETVDEIIPIFKEEADVSAIFQSVFSTFFNFGIRVYNGELEDSETNREHIFNVLYCMMMTYFKVAA